MRAGDLKCRGKGSSPAERRYPGSASSSRWPSNHRSRTLRIPGSELFFPPWKTHGYEATDAAVQQRSLAAVREHAHLRFGSRNSCHSQWFIVVSNLASVILFEPHRQSRIVTYRIPPESRSHPNRRLVPEGLHCIFAVTVC
jgi:hypothetical protein